MAEQYTPLLLSSQYSINMISPIPISVRVNYYTNIHVRICIFGLLSILPIFRQNRYIEEAISAAGIKLMFSSWVIKVKGTAFQS